MRLDGMPTTDRRVRSFAEKNLLQTRPKGRGKGVEISVASLPERARRDLEKRYGLPAPIGEPIQAGLPSPASRQQLAAPASVADGLTHGCGDEAIAGLYMAARTTDERARIDEALCRLRAIEPLVTMAQRQSGKRRLAEERARIAQTSWQTIYRWLDRYQRGGLDALIDRPRADKGAARVVITSAWELAARGCRIQPEQMAEISRQLIEEVRGLWAQQGMRSWRQVAELASARLTRLSIDAGMGELVASQVCRLTRTFVEAERRFAIVALKDKDAKGFYDRIPSIERSRAELLPGDLVIGDVTPLDVPVLRSDGSVGWPRMIVWQDAATNWLHVTLYLPDKGSGVRREHVALSFAQMCADAPFGLPRRLYLDNGSEFSWTSMIDAWAHLARFTGGAFGGAWDASVLRQEGALIRTIPFRPRGKPIEGQFANLLHYLSWIPGFAGSDRMRKKVSTLGKGIEPQALDEVRRHLAAAIAMYHGLGQSGHLDGQSPAEAMDGHINAGYTKVRPDATALSLAFSELIEKRKVHGSAIAIHGIRYYAPNLIQYEGETVSARWPRHAPDVAYVFHRARLVATAMPLPVFGFVDPEGARFAAKLASDARQAVEDMRGMCSFLDVRDLMGELAAMRGVHRVVAAADATSRAVELSDEAKAMLEARNQAALEAVATAAKRADPRLLSQWAGTEDEAANAARLQLGL